MSEVMTVQCPSCSTEFPVDPAKVPEGGVRTQCTVCETVFRVDPPLEEGPSGAGGIDLVADPLTAGAAAVAAMPAEDIPAEPAQEMLVEPAEEALVEDSDPLPMLEGTEIEVETAGSDWAADSGSDWVVETEEVSSFGDPVDVERLDTVEEQMRSAKDEEVVPEEGISQSFVPEPETPTMEGFMTGDEVMLPDMDLGGGELEVAPEMPEPADAAEAVSGSMDFDVADSGFDMTASTPEVEMPTPEPAAEVEAPAPEIPTPQPEPAPGGFQFGRRDPHDKARRLARVLVSDMITYNPDRHTQALANGTLKADFEDEIGKSWAEYVEQVGQDMAESTNYWSEALNEILAKGEPLF